MIESIGDQAFYDCGNIKDVYVYIANSKDIRIDMNTFSCWKSATLHIPTFSYESYYWDTQWGQFYEKVEITRILFSSTLSRSLDPASSWGFWVLTLDRLTILDSSLMAPSWPNSPYLECT